jgi:hypothetical protein
MIKKATGEKIMACQAPSTYRLNHQLPSTQKIKIA